MVVHNPNNWHWVDKNCIDWARDYVNQEFSNIEVTNDDSKITISSVTSLEGDCEVIQRKGKIMGLFDLKLTLSFAGELGTLKGIEGSIMVPEVAYDSTEDDYQFDVSVYKENSENSKIRDVIRSHVIPLLRKRLSQFGSQLLLAHGKDIQEDESKVNSTYTKQNTEISYTQKSQTTNTASKSSSASVSAPKKVLNTSTLHLEPEFNTAAQDLYLAFIHKPRIGAWSRADPRFEGEFLQKGTEFALFGGAVECKMLEMQPNTKLEMQWKLSSWSSFANLTLDFYQSDYGTKLKVFFKGIPVGEEDATRNNFEEYYVRAIKLTFGYGAVL